MQFALAQSIAAARPIRHEKAVIGGRRGLATHDAVYRPGRNKQPPLGGIEAMWECGAVASGVSRVVVLRH